MLSSDSFTHDYMINLDHSGMFWIAGKNRLHKESTMKYYLGFTILLLLLVNTAPVDAAWTEPNEIISKAWGTGIGQFGLRVEGGYEVYPAIEYITLEKQIILSDPVNRKQMIFSSKGELLNEIAWDTPYEKLGKAVATTLLSQKGRAAVMVRTQKITAGTNRITMVFSDSNVIVDSEHDIARGVRDAAGFIYGIGPDRVVRFDKNGKQVAELIIPRAHEELVYEPGRAGPRGVYVEYGEPVVATNGDVYVGKKTDITYTVLKWAWQ